jgi:peptide/nickel transport system substrate-binding protein
MTCRRSLGLLLALLAGCSQAAHRATIQPHTLVLADGFGDPSTLNPLLLGSWVTSVVTDELALANFTRQGSDNLPQAFLLTRIPSQANGDIQNHGTRIVFHLRPHLRWSDGAALTADDVAFTVAAIKDPANNALTTGFDDIAKVDVLNPTTVKFTLTRPYADFRSYYFGSDGFICILPRHAFHGLDIEHSNFNAKPIGAGPFRVVTWRRGDYILFERNPYYDGPPAKLSTIVYKLENSIETVESQFEAGDVQLWGRIPETLLSHVAIERNVRVTEVHPDAYFHLDFNMSRVTDLSTRQAIRLALDRASIVRDASLGRGHLQEGIIREADPLGVTLPLVRSDPEHARKLLRGRRQTLTLVYPLGDPEVASMVEIIRSQLAAVGITLATKGSVTTTFLSPGGTLASGNWDLALFNWSFNTTADLSPIFGCDQEPPNGNNAGRYCNPSLQRLMNQFKSTYDQMKRERLVRLEERIIDQDVPTIVLFTRTFGYAAHGVSGFHPPNDTPFDTFANVDVVP